MTSKVLLTKNMLKTLAEMLANGETNGAIADVLSKENKTKITTDDVKLIIKRTIILKKQIISTDKEFKEVHKETLLLLLNKARENMNILDDIRNILVSRFNKIKGDMPHSQLMMFNKEISISLRTYSDIIKTTAELLKRMETETTDIKLSQVQMVQETVKILPDLEKMGYIKITPDFYKSDLYSETK